MNKSLRQLFTIVVALFVILGMSTTIIMAIRANQLTNDARNVRALYHEYGAPRGSILAADGSVIAKSDPSNDSFSYQRSYSAGELYAPVTGFFSISQRGWSGVEASRSSLLSGQSEQLLWQRFKSLFTGQENKGANIETSIDPKIQQAAYNSLGSTDGAAVAIEPKTKAGQEKMGIALAKLAEEDPTFKTYTDEETGQTIIAGMGELHLEIIVDRLLREFKVEANVGAPQVAYRETIRKEANQETKYARQSGGKGQYGHVKIKIEPNEPGKGYEFVNAIVGGAIPKEYIPAVDNGIQGAMKSGILAGYPVVDVKVTLWDGSYHEVDSSEMAFSIAGSMAFKDAMKKADPVIMEPIMKVDVVVPDEYMGNVIGDLNSRRGAIQNQESTDGTARVTAMVPLSEMFGYATDLRSKTQGRGQYSMEPADYQQVPKSVADKIMTERNKG